METLGRIVAGRAGSRRVDRQRHRVIPGQGVILRAGKVTAGKNVVEIDDISASGEQRGSKQLNRLGIAEHGDGIGAVGEAIGRHAGHRDAGGYPGRAQVRVRGRGGPAAGDADVQYIGTTAEIGDELVVGGVGQHLTEAERDRIIAAAGQDALHMDEACTPQVDGVSTGKIGIDGVEASAAVELIG